MTSAYAKQIIAWDPRYLIEIHGHGGKKVAPNIIEVSSGSREQTRLSERFAEVLDQKIKTDKILKEFVVKGDFDNVTFKAKRTATITHKKWIAFHIELPPALRINNNNDLPEKTSFLVHCLKETIKEVCI